MDDLVLTGVSVDVTQALPCPVCGHDIQTGPDWDDDGSVCWNCECGLDGPDRPTMLEAILAWNEMVFGMCKR